MCADITKVRMVFLKDLRSGSDLVSRTTESVQADNDVRLDWQHHSHYHRT